MWILENNHYHHHHHFHSHHAPAPSIIGISTPFLNSIVDTVWIFFHQRNEEKDGKCWKDWKWGKRNERKKEKMYYWKIFLEEINFYLNERTLNMFVMHSKSFMKCKYAVYYMMGINSCNSQHWHCICSWFGSFCGQHYTYMLCECLLYFCENCDNE